MPRATTSLAPSSSTQSRSSQSATALDESSSCDAALCSRHGWRLLDFDVTWIVRDVQDDTPVLRAARLAGVIGDRLRFAITLRCHLARCNTLRNQIVAHCVRAVLRQLHV